MERQKVKREMTWVDHRWNEALEIFSTTIHSVRGEREKQWVQNCTAIVSERFAKFSINRAWPKIKEVQLSIDTTIVRNFQWV